MKTEHLQVRISPNDKQGLEELAKVKGMNMSELITYMVRREIEQNERGIKMNITDRRIIEVFEFGFEEMEIKPIIHTGEPKLYHQDDFENGSMKQFKNYTVGRFSNEFDSHVSFR